jgi:hypothetical protein
MLANEHIAQAARTSVVSGEPGSEQKCDDESDRYPSQ